MSNHVQEFSPDFTHTLHAATEKRRLMPLILAALAEPNFPKFSIHMEGWDEREHDGWWHPSSHSLWKQRKLFLYLARPDLVEREEMGATGVEAVTSGKFWHLWFQTLLQTCTDVLPDAELFLENSEHRIHGHCDGQLALDGQYDRELLEIKTINDFQFPKLTTDQEVREIKPGYYGQAQDYLAMRFGFGVGTMRFLVVKTSLPYSKNEFTVRANERYQRRRWQVYADTWGQVQEYRAGGDIQLAEACCMPGSGPAKVCECRFSCPIGVKS